MEFSDFVGAVRRFWPTWLGVTVVGVVVAAVVLVLTPATYAADARVFVAASPTIPNSAQFAEERVKNYPGVATSASVLAPVIDGLHLAETPQSLAAHVSTTIPANTSQLVLRVTDREPARAAAIANAVAQQLITQVEGLEMRASGQRLLALTVSDPATAPTRAVSPVAADVLGLGALVGLCLGLAAAVLRDRRDTAVRTADDVRQAWGVDGAGLRVLAARRGRRARRSALLGGPASELARTLELAPTARRHEVLVLAALPEHLPAARGLADDVAASLQGRGLPATVVTGRVPVSDADPDRVHLCPTDVITSSRSRQQVGGGSAVLVVPSGALDAAELQEVRALLDAQGISSPTVALLDGRQGGRDRTRPGNEDAAPSAVAPKSPAGRERLPAPAAGTGR